MSYKKTADKRDIYAEVTDRMIEALKSGTVPWQRPWKGEHNAPRNLQTGKRYRGINAILLALSGYSDPRWTTFKAAAKLDGRVRKGEKSTLVTLWKRIEIADPAAPNGKRMILFLRHFNVFNAAQVDWPEGAIPAWDPETPDEAFDPIDAAEDVFDGYLARPDAPRLTWGGSSAHYRPLDHVINLPDRESFLTAEGFYSTAFHEAAHSTGHSSMLDRGFGAGFGSEPYAREELVAEMSAAFLCAEVGIEATFDQSAAYIKGWLTALANDEKLVLQAAGKAQKAVDLILNRMIEETITEAAPAAEGAIPA